MITKTTSLDYKKKKKRDMKDLTFVDDIMI